MHVADLFSSPCADGIASAHEVVRVVDVKAFHAAGRSTADVSGQHVHRVSPRFVVGFGVLHLRAEALIVADAPAKRLHHAGRLEPSDRRYRTPAREPEKRGERVTVDDRRRLDDRRQSATAPIGDADVTTQTAAELLLDRRAIFVTDVKVQPSLFRTFRLMSA
jgi:hypothetical protein